MTLVYHYWQPHELIWVAAAMTLPAGQRNSAYRDIAAMSGRSLLSVQSRAFKMLAAMSAERARLGMVA